MTIRVAALCLLAAALLPAQNPKKGAPPRQPHIVFVTGDDEYRSEYTMPAFAAILQRMGMKTSIAYARPTPQANDNIEGLEALKTADLAVFYLRWRALPEDQLKLILDYANSGKPMVGLRTSTHSFKYPNGHPRAELNDGWPMEVFGTKWTRHHGHLSTTDVSIAAGAEGHPILRGIANETFRAPSWLYVVEPLGPGSTPLLTGKAINPQGGRDAGPQSVAWTRTYKGGRVFFTTLGHPGDFRVESVRRLVLNGILWAAGRQVPAGGAAAEWIGEYNPPADGIPPKPKPAASK